MFRSASLSLRLALLDRAFVEPPVGFETDDLLITNEPCADQHSLPPDLRRSPGVSSACSNPPLSAKQSVIFALSVPLGYIGDETPVVRTEAAKKVVAGRRLMLGEA